MTIKVVSETAECCSCGACNSICPKDAIIIKSTNIGRKYADVNDNCIDCGLCVKVCPVLNVSNQQNFQDIYVGNIHSCYVGKSLDECIYVNSQSGGMCTTVLKYLFDKRLIDAAVVTYMDEGSVPHVHGQIVTSVEELYNSQKSCYTMVDVLSVLNDTFQYKSIAVVGLPCQIHAVNELSKASKRYSNIKYRMSLVCDRSLCSLIQDVMLDLAKLNGEHVRIQWRNKNGSFNNQVFSYHNAPITISSKGKIIASLSRENRLALKDFFTPPCCHNCTDKLGIYADLVFGDPWGVSGIDSKNGESLVIIRTETGEKVISECVASNYATLRRVDTNEVIKGQKIDKKRNKAIGIAEKQKSAFLSVEMLNKEDIIAEAKNVLDNYNKHQISMCFKLEKLCKRVINKIIK